MRVGADAPRAAAAAQVDERRCHGTWNPRAAGADGRRQRSLRRHGLPVDFAVDVTDLNDKFKKLQWQLHPDKFAMATEEEKGQSADASTAINRAYTTLKSPLARGMYMLELLGHPVTEDTQVADIEFLGWLMEMNEDIEDAEGVPDRLSELAEEVQGLIADAEAEITRSFTAGDVHEAKDRLVRLKYLDNCRAKIVELR